MTNEELVQLYQQGNKQALDKLINNNTGIVYKLANKFYVEGTNSIDREDLIQEGFIGLMIAAEKYKFDIDNPAKFITYAIYWIYQKMNRFMSQRNTSEETSLNTPIGESGECEILDFIEGVDYGFDNAEEKVFIKNIEKSLDKATSQYLTLKRKDMLYLYYGLNGIKPLTHNEISELYGISRNGVAENIKTALRRLRYSEWGTKEGKELYEEL